MSISSVGIGSGILTSDLLEQLKQSDTSILLDPIKNKINNINNKESQFKQIESIMVEFKSKTESLASPTIFDNRASNISNSNVEINNIDGVDVQSFEISNISLAQTDIYNTNTVYNKSDTLSNLGNGTLNINIDNIDYSISYDATDTLESINDKIKIIAGDSLNSIILKVSENSYELSISAKDTNKNITFTDSNATNNSLLNNLGFNELQNAKPATFDFNGINITRDNNSFSDLIDNVDIKLINNSNDISKIDITQDNENILTGVEEFVSLFNSVITSVSNSTNKDTGALNGESYIKSISRDLTSTIFDFNLVNNNLIDYGIDIDKDGVMTFDKSILNNRLNNDPSQTKDFFTNNNGLFSTLNNKLDTYTHYGKGFDIFENSLESEKNRTTNYYEKETIRLEARYEILKKQFIAYDSVINKLNTQFASLNNTILQNSTNN